MPFNSKIPDKIPSWTAVREGFRLTNPAAMGQMRFLEKFAAMLRGATGNTKSRQKEFESFAQEIWNQERPLPFAERRYLRVAEMILDACQTYFQANRSVDSPSNRDFHMAELLCKYVIMFGVDGDDATIIAKKGCTPLLNQLVRLLVVQSPSIDFVLPDFVKAYDLEKNGPLPTAAPAQEADATEEQELNDLSAWLGANLGTSAANVGLAAQTFTPTRTALEQRAAEAQKALQKAIEEAKKAAEELAKANTVSGPTLKG